MARGLGVCLFVVVVVLGPLLFPAGSSPVDASLVPTAEPPRPALLGTACADAVDGIELPASGPRRTVALSYCLLLRRSPDRGGLDYWASQLESGLSPVQMVTRLVDSDEYRARGVQPFRRTLSTITLSPARVAAESASGTATTTMPAPQPEVVAVDGDNGLRVRQAITADRFDQRVALGGLVAPDRVTPALVHGRVDRDGQRINVIYVHLSATRGVSVSPGDRGRATVGRWASEIGAHAAINGNWYAPFDGPAVSGGATYGGDDHFYTALFGFTAAGDAVIEHHREVNGAVDRRVVEGVSGHPTLIFRGTPTTDFGNDPTFTRRHPRTAIGLDRSGDVLILVTVDGRRSSARGMTGAETTALLADLGAHDALMLDGGGSTTMWIAGRGVVNNPSGSLRSVGNQLAVFGD